MIRAITVVLVFVGSSGLAVAEEIPITSRIESVGLFKNGLAVVKRTVKIPQAGIYRLNGTITPVHGTFWVESDTPVIATATLRDCAAPSVTTGDVNLQRDLGGQEVTVYLRDSVVPPIKGRVAQLGPSRADDTFDRQREYPFWPQALQGSEANRGRFLILDTSEGRSYVDLGQITHVSVGGKKTASMRRQPVLLLNVDRHHVTERPVTISYLTRGLSWAPSYRVIVSTSNSLSIEQQATIKNELEDVHEAEFRLISGFPSVQMQNVTSPLSLNSSLARFFQQLEAQDARFGRGTQAAAYTGNTVVAPAEADLSAIPAGEGADLHFQSIGRRSLGEGEAVVLSVAKATAGFERIVEWVVSDSRQPGAEQTDSDGAWDVVRFRNPFPFPMTTGPVLVTSDGNFNGQQSTFWVNVGEQTTVRVTKALSVRTRATEQQQPGTNDGGGRSIVHIGNRVYRRANAKGELTVNNHRKEEITMLIRRQFSGELVKADGDPKVALREEGIRSVNPQSELSWSLKLKPGEEKRLSYEYTVLAQ